MKPNPTSKPNDQLGREITLYRLLKPKRFLPDGSEHDECESIVSRNPKVRFEPGLTNAEVDHEIHAGTNWDQDAENYPGVVSETWPEGQLGRIIVSIRVQIAEFSNESDEGNFRAHELYANPNHEIPRLRTRWWVARTTQITKVRIERVLT